MTDSKLQRINMVESQVRPSDVTDRRIIRAMLEVPREAFVPPALASMAYMDEPVPVLATRRRHGCGAQPAGAAHLCQARAAGRDRARRAWCWMWAAPPATRRPCWRGWPSAWWRSSATQRWRAGHTDAGRSWALTMPWCWRARWRPARPRRPPSTPSCSKAPCRRFRQSCSSSSKNGGRLAAIIAEGAFVPRPGLAADGQGLRRPRGLRCRRRAPAGLRAPGRVRFLDRTLIRRAAGLAAQVVARRSRLC